MSPTAKDWARQLANVVVIPLSIAFTVWPRDRSVGDISRSTQPLLAAAGWAFSIWGLIFAGQLAYAVYQALPSQRADPALRRVGALTALACLGGAVWTGLFTQRLFASAWVCIVLILGALIAIELRLRDDARHGRALWLLRVPFAVYLGWISVATLLNSAQFFASLGWTGAPFTALAWASALCVAAALLGIAMAVVRRNLAFALVIVWGLAAIAAEVRTHAPTLASVAAIGAGAVLLVLAIEAIGLARGRISWNLYGPLLR